MSLHKGNNVLWYPDANIDLIDITSEKNVTQFRVGAMDDHKDCVRGVVDGASRNNILINEMSIDQEILEVKFLIRLIDNDNVASKKKTFLPAKVWSTGVRRMFNFKADNLFPLGFSDKFGFDECDEITHSTHPSTGQHRIA